MATTYFNPQIEKRSRHFYNVSEGKINDYTTNHLLYETRKEEREKTTNSSTNLASLGQRKMLIKTREGQTKRHLKN